MRRFWQVVIVFLVLVARSPCADSAEEQWIAELVELTGYEEEYRGPEPPSNYPGLRNLSPGAPVCASFHTSGREVLVVAEGWRTYESVWEDDHQEVPDHRAYFWSTVTGEVVERFDQHRAPIVGCALAPDGRRAVTASRDGVILLWDLGSRRVVHRWKGYVPKLEGSGRFVHFAFSADGTVLAAATWGGPLRVWDTASGHLLQEIDVEPTELAISPDGNQISWREKKAGTLVADIATGEVVQRLQDPKSSWYSAAAAFSRDGSRIYTASGRRVTEWDLSSGTPRRQLIHPSDRGSGMIQGLEVSPDGSLLLSWGGVPEIAVFDLESGEVVGQPTVRGPDVVSASFTSQGRQIRALAGNTWQASVWNVPQAPSSLRLGVNVLAELKARGVEEESLTFSPDDATLAAVLPSQTSGQKTLRLWSTETWEPSRDLVLHTYGHPRQLTYSPDGREIVISDSGQTYLVDAETGEYLELERNSEISGVRRVYKTDIEIPAALLYAPQGHFFPIDDRPALFGRDREECVRLWDLKSLRPLTRYALEMFTRLTVMPDGETALVWRPDADHPVLIDVFSGKVMEPLETLDGRVLGVAPEGDRIVVRRNQHHLAVLSFPELQEIAAWEVLHQARPVHFLGSGILTSHRDGQMRIWSPDSEQPIRTIAIHASGLKRVVLSHDRKTAVSLDASDRLLAWQVPDLSEARGD